MNKAELISAVAMKADVSKKDAEAVITATLDVITAALQECEKVQLVGFGSFEVKKRAARIGRNPKTKESIEIPASKRPSFTAGKALKEIKFKPNILIAGILRNRRPIVPSGDDVIMPGDKVIVKAANHRLYDLSDIIA